jgi:ATP-dependent DNA ligase
MKPMEEQLREPRPNDDQNPYYLAKFIDSSGFKIADKIERLLIEELRNGVMENIMKASITS